MVWADLEIGFVFAQLKDPGASNPTPSPLSVLESHSQKDSQFMRTNGGPRRHSFPGSFLAVCESEQTQGYL